MKNSTDNIENIANMENIENYPYLKYFINKSLDVNIIDDIPSNYLDYMIVDLEAERLLSLGLFECDDHFVMELEALNDNYDLSIKYKFHISMNLHCQICEVMEVYFGEPEMVDYNLNTACKFKLIKGGKSK